MKNTFLRRSLLLLLVILPISLSDCKKEEIQKERDFYVVDVASITDWNYWVVAKDGGSLFILTQNNVPSVINYKPSKNYEGYTIFLDEYGAPKKTIINNNIFLFGNYTKNTVDVSVVLPNGNISSFTGLTINHDFTSLFVKGSQVAFSWDKDKIIKYAGWAAGSVSCVAGFVGAVPTAGISLGLTYIGCAATVVSIISDFLPEDFEVLGMSADVIGAAATSVGCLTTINLADKIACVSGLAETATAIYGIAKKYSDDNKTLEDHAIEILSTGLKVTTRSINDITSNAATVGGTSESINNSIIIERGIYWGTSQNPELTGKKLQIGIGAGSFSTSLTGLTPNTPHYVKAYAINSQGTAYGDQVSFTTSTGGQTGTLTDIDRNVYTTVTIGTQIWMAENLKTTKYNDGTAIPNITVDATWAAATTGAYSDYSNNPANSTIYGRLYNWYAADNNAATKVVSNGGKNVCPTGWHVPTDVEWTTLTTYLGGESVAGDKLKETGTTHWLSPNTEATNETGFTALPGGLRFLELGYFNVGKYGCWWSSTEYSSFGAWGRRMDYSNSIADRNYYSNQCGYSIRCLKDF